MAPVPRQFTSESGIPVPSSRPKNWTKTKPSLSWMPRTEGSTASTDNRAGTSYSAPVQRESRPVSGIQKPSLRPKNWIKSKPSLTRIADKLLAERRRNQGPVQPSTDLRAGTSQSAPPADKVIMPPVEQ